MGKYLSRIVCWILGTTCILTGCGLTSSGNAAGGSKSPVKSMHTPRFDDITFVDKMHGWASSYEDSGSIYSTNNGGETWSNVTPRTLQFTPQSIYLDFFLNTTTAWVIHSHGNALFIYRTVDSGKRWTMEGQLHPLYPGGGIEVDFTTSSQGYLENWLPGMGDMSGVLYRTDNGGNTWNKISVTPTQIHPVDANYLPFGGGGLYFENAKSGWTWGSPRPTAGPNAFSLLYHTTNGAKSWLPVDLPIGQKNLTTPMMVTLASELSVHGQDVAVAVDFRENGSARKSSNTQRLFLSQNGGTSWTVKNMPQATIVSMTFINPMDGWLLLQNDELFRTVNGGDSWSLATVVKGVPYTSISSLQFVSPTNGFILENGYLFRTDDGGETWSKVGKG